ncbi:MAG TPA: recombinase [Comamonadaceae bacterium]|uniref:site-specific recombinase n=1 Tax=Pulveribacter sp. TaxID=2678893 RepID=UPI000ED6216F|nr:site-specific recombinase [Pulveribacter sp.]HCL86012.1 recombinase [Comamonadaceae bacterium]
MRQAAPTLAELLAALDARAGVAQRHLQLIALLDWIRGDAKSVPAATGRLALLVEAAERSPEVAARLSAWWSALVQALDITTLLADFGFAQRTSMGSELMERLRYKLLPASPDTLDASELFMLALPGEFDARWLAAIDDDLLARLRAVIAPDSMDGSGANAWQLALLDAMTYCAGQILSTGFAPELRLRMTEETREAQPFHALIRDVESLRVEVLHPLRTPERRDAAVQRLRERLDACRAAASSVYAHFEDNGISVGLVFRLRQLRERILRVRDLLECLLTPRPAASAVRLLARLVTVGRERRSVRALLASSSSLLAAKVAERSAETGEHYITRTAGEYLAMVRKAAGGGAVMAFTTLIKLGLYALALPVFWGGFLAGINYAASFVLIQLLHFTVATKQPAMTAPAMAAKLNDLDDDASVEEFVDKVTHLVRSQVAAVLGNVLLVFPVALALALGIGWLKDEPALDETHARQVLESLHLLGPSLLFAAFTGVLLFASSIFAGWVENWFVLRRLDSAIQFNPRITRTLGQARAVRWAHYLRENISGFAANVSLGFMLGLAPAFAGFFGLGLEVRHVTLSAGQAGAAAASLGWQAVHEPLFWWAVAMIPFNGALNVLVSFYLAFRVALRAHNVSGVDRSRIYRALRSRLVRAPLSFFLPSRSAV